MYNDNQMNMNYNQNQMSNNENNGNFGWAVLGFFVPIVGLILYILWKDNRKNDAKNAGIGALVGFILSVVLVVLLPAFLINTGWNKTRNTLMDNNCTLAYGEEYKSLEVNGTWYCENTITGERLRAE